MHDGPRSHDAPAPSTHRPASRRDRSPAHRPTTGSKLVTLAVLGFAGALVVAFPAAHLAMAAAIAGVGAALAACFAGVLAVLGLAARVSRVRERASLPTPASRRPSGSTDEAPE